MKSSQNTYENTHLTFLLYQTDEGTFVGACEELCLLVEEKSRKEAKNNILKKARNYIKNVSENSLGQHLLNQTLPDEVKEEFFELVARYSDNFERWKYAASQKTHNLCPA